MESFNGLFDRNKLPFPNLYFKVETYLWRHEKLTVSRGAINESQSMVQGETIEIVILKYVERKTKP